MLKSKKIMKLIQFKEKKSIQFFPESDREKTACP